jgi:hypothetical protein
MITVVLLSYLRPPSYATVFVRPFVNSARCAASVGCGSISSPVARRLDILGIDAPTSVLSVIQVHIGAGQWEVFLQYLRFYLLEWCDILGTVCFQRDVIDTLC